MAYKYSSTVANQQAALNAANFGKTPGFQPLSVDGLLGPLTQNALAQYGTPQGLNMMNGAPVISTDILQQNGVQPQLPQFNQLITPQQFVAGLTPITTTPLTAINAAQPGAANTATKQIGGIEGQRSVLANRLAQAQQQLLGQGQEQLQLEQQAGIPQSVRDLNLINEQIAVKKAQFDQTQQNYRSGQILDQVGSGKIQQLEVQKAVELGNLSAIAMAKQGSIDAAKEQVDRTLKMEFDPIRQEIENTKTFIDLNMQDLSRADKIQAQAVNAQLDREKADLDYFRDIKKMYLQDALKNGNAAQMSAVSGARSLKDLSALNQDAFNSATIPSEKIEALNSTLTLIDSLKNSSGLNSRVGPNSATRRFLAFGDAFGAGDAFAGSVHQLTSQQTLNSLINLKAQGGTLGALSDQERIMLQSAASKIAAWERKDSSGVGKGTWDVTEKVFKQELDRLTTLTNNALTRAGGMPATLSGDDYQQIQALYNSPAAFNPASFY